MLWYETTEPAVVVMLTQTHESGREKCYPYFPPTLENPTLLINEQDEFGDNFICTLTLISMSTDPATRSTIRELELSTATGEKKTVWHFLYEAWLDFLVPEGDDRQALINLIMLTREKNTDLDSPRIVHCSAGVGRSGTFIALDWLLRELDEGAMDDIPLEAGGANKDPILEVVECMRQQRMMMVQSETQFYFLYDVIRDLWKKRFKEGVGVTT